MKDEKDYIIDRLLDCIRDGIEMNYNSWAVWQFIARGVVHLTNPTYKLDSVSHCMDVYKGHLRRNKKLTLQELYDAAEEDINVLMSLYPKSK